MTFDPEKFDRICAVIEANGQTLTDVQCLLLLGLLNFAGIRCEKGEVAIADRAQRCCAQELKRTASMMFLTPEQINQFGRTSASITIQ
jgi:hypothetical protein